MKLENKIALVTGASRGIGKAIALALAREGADVAAADIQLEALQDTVRELEALGRRALPLQCDVSRTEDAQKTVDAVLDKWERVDILVNNAGITRDNLLLRMKEEDWDSVLDINLKGAFNFTKAVTRAMFKQQSGRIVNIASVIGLMGNAGQSNYAASKGGLIAFTKSCAKEMAPRHVTVNALAPGFIETPMTAKLPEEYRSKLMEMIPLKKLGQPEDIARAVVFLVSEDAAYITGEVLRVDGGMAM